MKKALLPLAIASLLPTAAFADVVVYGRANVTVQAVEKSDTNYTEVASNASRIGVKGSEVINDDLKVIYQFEYQTRVDDGSASQTCEAKSTTTAPATTTTTCKVSGQTFTQRNIYVGLQGTGGTVMAGMFDTPLKAAQEKVDLFNDLVGDLTEVLEGEIRAKNIVQYSSPAFANITLNAAYIASEHDVENAVDGFSGSIAYSTKPFYFAVGADRNVKLASDQKVSAVDVDLARAVARVTFGPVVLGAMYEVYDNGVADEEDGFLVSAQFNITDAWALKAQTAQSDMKMLGGESTSIGVDYKMSKAAKLFGFYTMIEDEVTRDDNYLAVGVELNF
ncbi:MAG: porin [Pseudomonadota bacterium]